MKRSYLAVALCLGMASAALAHQGVQNPAVKARMDAMSAIGDSMKVLGAMAKKAVAFDADTAQKAAAAIAEHAAQTPSLFEAIATDPKSEAKPAIWEDFEDFTMKAAELEKIASGLSASIHSPDDAARAMRSLGANCKSCHEAYRE